MRYYSAIKKNEILICAATCTDLENIILGEVRQRQTLYDITYTWNLKNQINESIHETDSDQENIKRLLTSILLREQMRSRRLI